MFSQPPFFRVGLNNYLPALSNLIDPGGNVYWLQPVHNIFLLIAVETGLIGLLITAFLFKNFFGKRKNKRGKFFKAGFKQKKY